MSYFNRFLVRRGVDAFRPSTLASSQRRKARPNSSVRTTSRGANTQPVLAVTCLPFFLITQFNARAAGLRCVPAVPELCPAKSLIPLHCVQVPERSEASHVAA